MNENLRKQIDNILLKDKIYVPLYSLYADLEEVLPFYWYNFPLKSSVKHISIIDDRMCRYGLFNYTFDTFVPKDLFICIPATHRGTIKLGWNTRKVSFGLGDLTMYSTKSRFRVWASWIYDVISYKREDKHLRTVIKKVLRAIYWNDPNFTWAWDDCSYTDFRIGIIDTFGLDQRHQMGPNFQNLRQVILQTAQLAQEAAVHQQINQTLTAATTVTNIPPPQGLNWIFEQTPPGNP